jgi:Tfp pilus assembly protein PilN
MSLDLDETTTLSDKGKPSSTNMPTKTTMNLYVPDSHTIDKHRAIPLGIALAVAVGLFTKFGVIDQLARVSQAQAQLAQQQTLVAQADSKLSDYDTVKSEYDTYILTSGGSSTSVSEIFNLIDSQVPPSAAISAINLKDNTLTLTLSNISLETLGTLSNTLKSQQTVSDVSVSAAQSASSTQASTATMTITLADENVDGSSDTSSTASSGSSSPSSTSTAGN